VIDDLPPLRDVVRRYGIEPRKGLGQNFLFDLNLTARIARAAGPLVGITCVEIGPGPGGLTRALLAAGAERVLAVEKDERCLGALADIAAHYPGRLDIVEGDALAVDVVARLAGRPARVVANLPYNIATILLTQWLESEVWPPWFDRLTLMFQREVALRIVATCQSRVDYGRLAILCGWRTKARLLFDVPATAFTPPPKVVSSVVELVPRPMPLECRLPALSAVTRAAFGQRRKMLRQALRGLNVDTEKLLADADIAPTSRAETLDIEAFVRLARAYALQR
jgi:16S rRNA (adenine1518-N6/adenine1519-N6)-dimethyltransferase